MLVAMAASGCSKEEGAAATPAGDPRGPAAGDVKPAPAPEPEPERPIDRIRAATTFAEAMAIARPLMADAVDEIDDGAVLLAAWGAEKMRWGDVAVARNETSLKLTLKDSDEARGKRMCASGRLVEIEKVSDDPKIFGGGLLVGYGDVYRFLAVGSTGELVGQSRARLCGVVIGQYAYANTGGGQTKAVMLVGMFDLPENKAAPGAP
jgi:hypothetical protein